MAQASRSSAASAAVGSLNAPASFNPAWIVASLACGLLLGFGWWVSEERYIRPDSGIGYGLGIAGVGMMTLLMGYSARKRMRSLASAGPIQWWFRVHMWLGVAGPVAILLHSNFQLESPNASVAMFSMLLVAGSGISGRFIYIRIHHGLSGHRIRLGELRARLLEADDKLRPLLEAFPEVMEPLDAFEKRCARPLRSAAGALWRLAVIPLQTRRVRARCMGLLEPVLYEEREAARRYAQHIRRIASFSSYERLFRLWHSVHIPLFVMMVLTLSLHVVAVHMY